MADKEEINVVWLKRDLRLYDNEAIYISAILFDPDPSKIPMEFTNRDNLGQADFFLVTINPNDDGQNGFQFIVMSTGSQAEAKISDGREDFSWNAVWASDVKVSEKDLVEMPKGTITEDGIRKNINVGILYIESWLRGNGAAALYNLMEDAATAEISRTQVWLWLHNNVKIEDGRTFNMAMYQLLKREEVEKLKKLVGEENFTNGKFKLAIELFDQLVLSKDYKEFLTLSAYTYI